MMTYIEGELKVGPRSAGSMGCPCGSHMIGGQGELILVIEMLKVFIVQKELSLV
jgi:hypothetical protein